MTNAPNEQTPEQPLRAAEDGVQGFTADSHDEVGELDIYEALIDPKGARAGKGKDAGGGGGIMPMHAGGQHAGAQGAASQGAAAQAAGAQSVGSQTLGSAAAGQGMAGGVQGVATRAGLAGALGAAGGASATASGGASVGGLGGAIGSAAALGRLGAAGAGAGLGTSAVSGGFGTSAAGTQPVDLDGDGIPDDSQSSGPSDWYSDPTRRPIGYDDDGNPIYAGGPRYGQPSVSDPSGPWAGAPDSGFGELSFSDEGHYAGGGDLSVPGNYDPATTYYAGGTRTADTPSFTSQPSLGPAPSGGGSADLGTGGSMTLSVDQGQVANQARVWDDWAADMSSLVGEVEAANVVYSDFGMVTHPASNYQTNHRTLSTWTGNASTEFGNMSTTLHMTAKEFAEIENSSAARANSLAEQTTLPTHNPRVGGPGMPTIA